MSSPNPAVRPALGSYVEPCIAPERLARTHAAIVQRLSQQEPKTTNVAPRWWLTVAALALSVALVLDGWQAQEPGIAAHWTLSPGARLESGEISASAQLEDGSRLELEARSAVRGVVHRPEQVGVAVERGRITFDVTPNPARRFEVEAGAVRVTVVGTRFSVFRREGIVRVHVEHGRVLVVRDDQRVSLGAGDLWEGGDRANPDRANTGRASTDRVEQETVMERHDPSGSATTPTTLDAGTSSVPSTERTEKARGATPPSPAPPQKTTPSTPEETSSLPASEAVEDPARALFESAREARRHGNPQRAAVLLAELVKRYPGDARAGVAAFELGRIRHDVLGDASGAISAWERALSLSPGGSFRADALARLAAAYDRSGQRKSCQRVRARFLKEYRTGVQAERVARLCP